MKPIQTFSTQTWMQGYKLYSNYSLYPQLSSIILYYPLNHLLPSTTRYKGIFSGNLVISNISKLKVREMLSYLLLKYADFNRYTLIFNEINKIYKYEKMKKIRKWPKLVFNFSAYI